MKKLWAILLLMLAGLVGFSLHLNFRHNTSACNGASVEIWAHRGLHTALPENSKQAVDAAFASGFTGVELDVFFDRELGLVVSHDQPYQPVDGRIVKLEDVITGYGPEFRFWLDLKNLRRGNIKPVRRALNAVLKSEEGLWDRVLIESGNGYALRRLNTDFRCIYWVQFNRSGLRGRLKLASVKFLISLTDFKGITTDHRYIDDVFARHFSGKCWYVFTVNDAERLAALKAVEEVEVVLTDLSKSEVNALVRPADI
jgi:glycerophosphoryl diester phosphodiesterase